MIRLKDTSPETLVLIYPKWQTGGGGERLKTKEKKLLQRKILK